MTISARGAYHGVRGTARRHILAREAPLRAIFAVLALAACGRVNEDNWPEKYAKAYCEEARKCDTANFYFVYDDEDQCRAATETVVQNGLAATVGCTFDKKSARKCLSAFDKSCKDIGERYDELFAPCTVVWTGGPCAGGGSSIDTFDTGPTDAR